MLIIQTLMLLISKTTAITSPEDAITRFCGVYICIIVAVFVLATGA